jgi:uncharacterized protein (UPF0248 family)
VAAAARRLALRHNAIDDHKPRKNTAPQKDTDEHTNHRRTQKDTETLGQTQGHRKHRRIHKPQKDTEKYRVTEKHRRTQIVLMNVEADVNRPRRAIPVILLVATALVLQTGIGAQQFQYPATRKVDHVDTYHGTTVADPYRWLEDDNAPETAKWVEAQNQVTFGYLERIPYRARLKARLETLYNYPKYSVPFRKGEYFFFRKNDGLQNQSVLYIQKGLEGQPEVLIDPNEWAEDGTVRLTTFSLSKDGKYAVYGVSQSGSDWQDYQVMEISTRRTLPEKLEWIKVSSVAWKGDGFFYSRYPSPRPGTERSSRNENHQVYFHRVGTPQQADEIVYQDPANPQRFHTVSTTEDERFAILEISERGKGKKGNALFVRDLSQGEREFAPLFGTIGDDTFDVIDNVGGTLLVFTDRGAPNGRVIRVDPKRPDETNWQAVLPERPEPLERASSAGGKLFATYLKDVTTRAYVFSLDGKLENEVGFPDLGSAAGFGGERDDPFVFYSFTSFNFRRSTGTTSPRGRACFSDPPRFPGSIRGLTRPVRCSTPARTARGCPCFSSTARDWCSRATTRRCFTGTAASTSRRRRASTHCAWRCSSRVSSTRWRISEAVASTGKNGTRRG